MRYPGWIVVGALAVAFLASSACGGGAGDGLSDRPDGETGRASSTSREEATRAERERTAVPESTLLTAPNGEKAFLFLHNSPTPAVGMSIPGLLFWDDAGCMRLEIAATNKADPRLNGTSPTLLLPAFGYLARIEDDGRVLVLNEEGKIVAQEGDRVMLSSGYSQSRTELAENTSLGEQTKRELVRRCPGMYYLTDTIRKTQ